MVGASSVRLFLAALAACCCVGCQRTSSFQYDALDIAPPQENLNEFPLGEYSIPIPVMIDGGDVPRHRNRLQLDFQLHALVTPERESEVANEWTRHKGKIRDQVIRVCRNASVDELQEPELSTLKARLMDALVAHVGESGLRRLLITEVVSQEL